MRTKLAIHKWCYVRGGTGRYGSYKVKDNLRVTILDNEPNFHFASVCFIPSFIPSFKLSRNLSLFRVKMKILKTVRGMYKQDWNGRCTPRRKRSRSKSRTSAKGTTSYVSLCKRTFLNSKKSFRSKLSKIPTKGHWPTYCETTNVHKRKAM